MKKIGIVILNYNGIKDTRECLTSLKDIKTSRFLHTIYVVDYSNDLQETQAINKEFPETVVIKKTGNLGFAGGNNVGIKQALNDGVDYILLLNNDTLVSSDFLQILFEYMEKNPMVGCISPKIYFAKGYEYHKDRYKRTELGKVIWYAGGLLDWQNMYGSHRGVDEVDQGQYDKTMKTDFASGCCMLVKKEVFEKIGFLNEKLFLYWEDSDFSVRAEKAGWHVVYNPKPYIWHKNAGSSGVGSSLHDYFLQRNRLWFGFHYAPLRTKLALLRQSLVQLGKSTSWNRRAIVDYYFMNMGIGSWRKTV